MSDAMKPNERIGKLFLLFLHNEKGLSFHQIKNLMSEAYRGEDETVRKKFQRDREDLRQLGMHLDIDQSGAAQNEADRVYIVSPTARTLIRDLNITEAQKSYLIGLLLNRIHQAKTESEKSDYQSIYLKLFFDRTNQSMPEPIETAITDPLYNENSSLSESLIEIIQNSILNRKRLFIEYQNSKGVNSRRTVQPLALNIYRRIWYITAFCDLAQDYRLFQADRISNAEPLNTNQDNHLPEKIQYIKPHPLNLKRESLQSIQLKLNADFLERFDLFTSELSPASRVKTGAVLRQIVTSNPEALFFWMFRHQGAIVGIGPASIRDRFISFLKSIQDRNRIEVNQ
ncbi:MAG: WYL domain-containing protein [Leptonema sp. (in: Bacteria)]|nr:WYL domain-containing protein [Leptonema sp. (in: bacteria)]